jgi:sulfonate transport system permease protein
MSSTVALSTLRLVAAPARLGKHRRWGRVGGPMLVSWLVPVLLILVWEAAVRLLHVSPHILPAPSKVAGTAWKLVLDGTLLPDMAISLIRAAAGFAIGGSIGLALGIAVGFSRIAALLLDRSVHMLRAIPFLAILPLVIVWLGIGEGAKVFLVAFGVSFPIYLNTVLGIRQVDPKLVEMGRVNGLRGAQLIRHIVLPGALPAILSGVRYALATAWLGLVVAETIAASSGIGFLAMDAREFLRTDVIVMVVVIYAIIGVVADGVARMLEHRLLSWHINFARVRQA